MFDNYLRGAKDNIFEAMVTGLGLRHIHPTHITIIALFFGIGAFFALWSQQYVLGLFLFIVNRLLDGLDGTVARINDLQSDLGGYVDILADFAAYAFLPLGLVLADPTTTNFIALAVLISVFYINSASWMYLAALLEKRKQLGKRKLTSIEMPAGLVGGTETMLFYGAFMLFPQQLVWLFGVMIAGVLVTIGQRLVWAIRYLD